jgi:hypothetical protein
MHVLGSSSDAEMVATFLHGELGSPRFADAIQAALINHGQSRELVEKPNLGSKTENAQRAAILLEYRPWLVDFGLLKDVPSQAQWHWVDLSREDIEGLHYVTYSYWDELSNGTHLVREGAKSVAAGKTAFGVSNDGFWEIASQLEVGGTIPPIIAVAGAKGRPHTVIEGHVRATGYLLAKHRPDAMRALFGIARMA